MCKKTIFNSIPDHKSNITGVVNSQRSSLRDVKKKFLLPSSGIAGISRNTRSVADNGDLIRGYDPSICVAETVNRSSQAR